MRDGIILINKPKGPSSNQTLQKVKQRLAIKKAGHFGTLDPLASGLLIIGLNKGTKLSKLFLNDDKSYEAVIKFGQRTNTDDAEGDVIDTSLKKVSKSAVVKTLSSFVGVQEQVPPAYSAIKIKGMPAYKYARDGKVIELQSRKINIYEVLMKDFEFPFLTLSIKCSKGTYIRSLARDIGINVDSCAHLHSLKRTNQGHFSLSEAHNENDVNLNKIYSIEKATNDLERCDITLDQIKILKNAKSFKLDDCDSQKKNFVRIYSQDIFLGVGKFNNNHLFKEFLV